MDASETTKVDVKEDDVKCREVLPVILYLVGYCCHAVFKKIKYNCCKDLISRRDNVEEIPEINSYFQGINRGSHLYPNCSSNSTNNLTSKKQKVCSLCYRHAEIRRKGRKRCDLFYGGKRDKPTWSGEIWWT